MASKPIPDIVVGRLPSISPFAAAYGPRRKNCDFLQELGERLGISAAQIRKDLSQFGEFGKQGTGYHIPYLTEQIQKILHIDREWEIAVIGAGDIGSAVARYNGFTNRGFRVGIIFDNDPEKIGSQVGNFIVQDYHKMNPLIHDHGIKVAMVTVPAEQAQEVTNMLVEAGIKAILNYAPISLTVPRGVRVQNVDPSLHLQRMTYYLES